MSLVNFFLAPGRNYKKELTKNIFPPKLSNTFLHHLLFHHLLLKRSSLHRLLLHLLLLLEHLLLHHCIVLAQLYWAGGFITHFSMVKLVIRT